MQKRTATNRTPFIKKLSTALWLAIGAIGYSTGASAASCASGSWAQGGAYGANTVIQYQGRNYQILQPHTAHASNWTPENTPALWKDLGACTSSGQQSKPTANVATPAGGSATQPKPTEGGGDQRDHGDLTRDRGTPTTKQAATPDELSAILSEAQFKQMFPQRHQSYTYIGFITAYGSVKEFATGDTASRKRELAAFLANVGHETGGLVYTEEIAKSDYCQPGGQYPCAPGKQYFGRGPMQISWNYNYGQIGTALNMPLLENPELISNSDGQIVGWLTAMWFWTNSTGAGKMTPHAAMTSGGGFGETIRTINGALECNGGHPEQVQDRVSRYQSYSQIMGINAAGAGGC
ncbi:MAG: glycoside hydrolase family 19 protein [Pseudomonadota bacterium]